ncbi:hypothetical protein GCM10010430_76830 [Kitasatospora cystarginea]|uniref:Uncharacterized protein n=1 Tax=Kitasatospora cystarginea TaxID=58350 RepID=A0ABP5S0B9_9ACTN
MACQGSSETRIADTVDGAALIRVLHLAYPVPLISDRVTDGFTTCTRSSPVGSTATFGLRTHRFQSFGTRHHLGAASHCAEVVAATCSTVSRSGS